MYAMSRYPLLALLTFCLYSMEARASSPVHPESSTTAEGVEPTVIDYRIMATKKTSTMDKELNEAASAGYRFRDVMGGDTSWGGSEVVVVMSKDSATSSAGRFQYRLLATSKTSTMQKELQEAGDAGFEAVGQTVFSSTFGGEEVVIILQRDAENPAQNYEYKLLATSKTETMQKELLQAGEAGFDILGLTVASTAMGGSELVCIVRRPRTE